METRFLEELAESFSFFGTLHDDLTSARKYLTSNDTQFARRTYIRTFFSFIEGNLFRIRQMALSAHINRKNCFSAEEVFMLEEKHIYVKDNGEVKIGEKHLDFKTSFKFTHASYAKAFSANLPDYSENGWSQLNEAQKIRNRITHPKSKEDFEISDTDLEIIDVAKEWYSTNVQYLLKGHT